MIIVMMIIINDNNNNNNNNDDNTNYNNNYSSNSSCCCCCCCSNRFQIGNSRFCLLCFVWCLFVVVVVLFVCFFGWGFFFWCVCGGGVRFFCFCFLWGFFATSSLRLEPSPTRTLKWPGCNRMQTMCNTLSTYHVQVSCNVPFSTKG